MNKIACAIMVSLSGICLLKGETVPQKTEWKGGRLIYDGVIIKNQFNLPQKGIKCYTFIALLHVMFCDLVCSYY